MVIKIFMIVVAINLFKMWFEGRVNDLIILHNLDYKEVKMEVKNTLIYTWLDA